MYIYNQVKKLLKENKELFWQYPVITEKEVFNQQKENENYFGFPWATIIDKKINMNKYIPLIKNILKNKKNVITTCQHIYFRKIIPLLKMLNITNLYTPHKVKREDILVGISINACPLYAVNFEDTSKNKEFRNVNYFEKKRKFLFSFMGGFQNGYMSDIRLKIFNLKKNKKLNKKHKIFIYNTGTWHFNDIVYGKQVNNKALDNRKKKMSKIRTSLYNNLLLDSRYSICPSGSGPNSIRFWESLACGAIPILCSDKLELPYHKLWNDAIVICYEDEIQDIDDLITKISYEKENIMRDNCLKIYNDFRNNFLSKNL